MPDLIAERILRLFASREEASTIAGDLREIAATRGKLWFWIAVARTAPSLLWRDLTSEPWFLMRLGLRGLLVTVCLGPLIEWITIGISLRLARGAGWSNSAVQTLLFAMWLITTALVQFIAGLYLAKRSRGREAAAVLTYIALNWLMRGGLLTYFAVVRSSKIVVFSWGNILGLVANLTPLFLGALLSRFRSRSTQSNA